MDFLRNKGLILGIALSLCPCLWAESPFNLEFKKDAFLFGTGAALSGADLILDNMLEINRQSYDKDKTYSKSDVNLLDRKLMFDYSKSLDKTGDILLYSAMLSPALLAPVVQSSDWFTIGVMYAESVLIANGVKELTKLCVNRARPMMYFESGDSHESYNNNGDFANSFFSGHSTLAFNGAAFTSYVFYKYFPDSPWRFAVAGGSFSVAAATAVVRILSGNHFMSDVLVGAVVGTATGILVPFFHANHKESSEKKIQLAVLGNGVLFRFCL